MIWVCGGGKHSAAQIESTVADIQAQVVVLQAELAHAKSQLFTAESERQSYDPRPCASSERPWVSLTMDGWEVLGHGRSCKR